MAIDGKYGRVTLEKGTVGEDEPVVVFRAQDRLLPQVLAHYQAMCADSGSPDHHLELINQTRRQVEDWQAQNYTQTPQSKDLA